MLPVGCPTATTTRFVDALLHPGRTDSIALVEGDVAVTHAELAERILARSAELALPGRSLVVLTGTRSLEHVVTYLALHHDGHVPLLAGDHAEELARAWRPSALVTTTAAGARVDRRDVVAHDIHPDLALLLSTSGSTGSPKLVRLSHANLTSNARAIADFLGLSPADRGITVLPLHYCYGLSVLHAHLLAGASVVLTEASVVDPCFRHALHTHGVTNVAGVPHTFELLERAGPELLAVPTLRFVTQAGGRMAPDAVRRWIDRTAGWAADFYVMYGQTEATARIAYLPPDIARRRPGAIGVPVPGVELELRPVDGAPAGTGELVVQGPGVMMGYAVDPGDLAAGRELDELATGDLARFHPDDAVFELVGRRSRFVKPFGVRVDLDAVEQVLADDGLAAAVAGDDDGLVVALHGTAHDAALVRERVAGRCGLPLDRVVVVLGAIPRTASDKVDYDAVRVAGRAAPTDASRDDRSPVDATVARTFARVLGRRVIRPDDTFVSLGGDSLNYVECSIRLEDILPRVPSDWHLRPVGELEDAARSARSVTRRPTRSIAWVDTTLVLRSVAICLVVSTHMRLRYLPGGAHLLLAVVGFNASRFLLPIDSTRERLRAGMRTTGRAALPAVAWVVVGMLVAGWYSVGTLLLVNNYVGVRSHQNDHWHFWFIEVFVHLTVLATLAFTVGPIRRADRRLPYALPLAVLAVALVLRLEWAQLDDWYNMRYRTHSVAWLFVLGWLVHRSRTVPQRLLTSAVALVVVHGFFGYPPREWFIALTLVVLCWIRELPVPRLAVRPIGTLAAASMWIYISHFSIWPPLKARLDLPIAYVLTILAGIGIAVVADRSLATFGRAVARRRARTGDRLTARATDGTRRDLATA